MKLFDILGGNVTIHEDALAIPAFKKIWEKDKADKQHAIAVISYIVFKNKWDSPYVLSMTEDILEEALKKEFFPEGYQLTPDCSSIYAATCSLISSITANNSGESNTIGRLMYSPSQLRITPIICPFL